MLHFSCYDSVILMFPFSCHN
uniref:Uncharacterized protein n=1 Tax=Anguilla anguilla TaxID=7936 RepID=A0A0E9V1Z9_ANGAN